MSVRVKTACDGCLIDAAECCYGTHSSIVCTPKLVNSKMKGKGGLGVWFCLPVPATASAAPILVLALTLIKMTTASVTTYQWQQQGPKLCLSKPSARGERRTGSSTPPPRKPARIQSIDSSSAHIGTNSSLKKHHPHCKETDNKFNACCTCRCENPPSSLLAAAAMLYTQTLRQKMMEDLALIRTLQWHPNLPWSRVYGTTDITPSKVENSLWHCVYVNILTTSKDASLEWYHSSDSNGDVKVLGSQRTSFLLASFFFVRLCCVGLSH